MAIFSEKKNSVNSRQQINNILPNCFYGFWSTDLVIQVMITNYVLKVRGKLSQHRLHTK